MFTKATIVEWSLNQENDIYPFVTEAAERLTSAGKTDNVSTEMDISKYKRVWTDQSAAEEWIAILQTIAAEHSATFTYEIIDNV